MVEEGYELKEIIFNKCPICKKGKVNTSSPTGFFKFMKRDKTNCERCNAIFEENDEKQGERTYTLDLSESDLENKYENKSLKISEWKNGISELDYFIESGILPSVDSDGLKIILDDNEKAHHYGDAVYIEERMIRNNYGGSVRVAKGIYLRTGQGESHGELRAIDKGVLLLTNQRLIFNGDLKHNEYKLKNILSVEQLGDKVEIGLSNRKKVQIFKVEDSEVWTAYIKIAVKKDKNPKKK